MEINSSGKTAIIGDKDSVLAFKALGMRVVAETNPFKAREAVKTLARENYSVILITERVAEAIPETLARYKAAAYPIIIPIPDSAGATGLGMQGLKADVEKAIGTDIIFKEN